MSTDEHAAIIEPRRSKREAALPASAVLLFTPQDLEAFLQCFPEPPRRGHKIFLADVYTGLHDGTPLAVTGPMLGAPQSVMVLERLIALGVRDVVAVGWCGSLQSRVRIGDVVLPTGAVSEEGTSAHYPLSGVEPAPAVELTAPLREALLARGLSVHEGRVWSTDAPFRETRGKVLRYQKEGILAVEMETSALFTVAHFRGIRLSVALIVSDDLSALKWTHGFRDPRFKETREQLGALTLGVVCSTARALSS